MILVQGAGSGGVRVGFIYIHNMYNHNDVGKGGVYTYPDEAYEVK